MKDKSKFEQNIQKVNSNKFLIIIVIILIILSTYSYLTEGIFYSIVNFDEQVLENFVLSYGAFSYLMIVLIVVIEVVFAPIPGLFVYSLSSAIFGPLIGGVLALIGNVLGASICFYLSRGIGRDYVKKQVIDKNHMQKFDTYSDKYGIYVLFFLRLNPFTSSDIFSYIAGLTRISFKHFILGTSLGLLPLIFLQSYFADVFLDNNLFRIILIAFTVVYVLIFIIGLYKIIRNKFK